jgi:UDP-N-acetylmuramoyl-tripeptide--D-alanyl-D-alanine ligase
LKLSEIAKIIDGNLVGNDAEVSTFCSNSKECSKDSLFFALKGAQRDGHDFIKEVYQKGGYAVSERDLHFLPYIKVQNTRLALTMAAFEKIKNSLRIAITGSCGKTTTKEMVSHLLSKKGIVCKSLGNFNTDVGISLSVLNGPENPEYAVLEIGARFPGDVKQLASIFKPHISVITCVGSSHSKFIDPLKEKLSIAEETEKFVLYDGEDQRLKEKLKDKGKPIKKYVNSFEYRELKTIVKVNNISYTFSGIWGKGQLKDLEFALTLMDKLETKWNLRDFEDFSFLKGRMNLSSAEEILIMDDTYNSNLESLFNSAQAAFEVNGSHVIWILAPIEEIKMENSELKERLEEMKDAFSPKAVFTVGENFYPFGEDYTLLKLINTLEKGDLILVKGSRVYALEKIVEEIRGAL